MAQRTCSVEGCGGKHKALGWCNAHYLKWRKENLPRAACSFPDCGSPVDSHGYCAGHAQQLRKNRELVPLRPARPDTCTVPGCTDPHQGLGYCNRHLIRFHVHGDPLKVRQKGENPRKWSLDESFFDEITTEAQAYWLGFITADGCVARSGRTNTLRVGLAVRDTDHLARMNADLGSDRPLVRIEREFPAIVATFDSWRLTEGLCRLGVGPNKTGTVEPWDGPAGLMPHYWRGLFDGDGSIYRNGSREGHWGMSLTGSLPCIAAFGEWARPVCGSAAQPSFAKARAWQWSVTGKLMPRRLAEVLYGSATVYLDRKHALACDLLATTFPPTAGKRTTG